MRIDALNDLAVEIEHEAQNAMGRRVLGPEVDRKVTQRGFSHYEPLPSGLAVSFAFSSPGNT